MPGMGHIQLKPFEIKNMHQRTKSFWTKVLTTNLPLSLSNTFHFTIWYRVSRVNPEGRKSLFENINPSLPPRCDRMVKLCFNIWPFAAMKIRPIVM